ncbi:MAG: RusA family crossover junction endodeoxyribonuclease [Alphaproteobacteria bacterium]|nr:RusA family crossover junction endodeoxyribonuclease [Alphaproteobacteria bacterium]MDE2014335.1 RusA family crossover junction endodeoxyribonuclease [Alphaproteobacteria bacterium]MDE2073645.1 RusA family crossover junction endodeoxyribonuclease [Alphaproteobacteria bacterium]
MNELEPKFPVEFIVLGTPISHQTASANSRDEWKQRVRDACRAILPEGHWATESLVAVTLYYFPPIEMDGDIDNIVKFILDALKGLLYVDDSQVERLVVQKFEPQRMYQFSSPSAVLSDALTGEKPLLYVRISTDPHEDLR